MHWNNLEVDRRIVPLFRSPIEKKKLFLLKKLNFDITKVRPKKTKLIQNFISLNYKLVKFFNNIQNYSKFINKIYLNDSNNLKLKKNINIIASSNILEDFKIKSSLDDISLKINLLSPTIKYNKLNNLNLFIPKKFNFTVKNNALTNLKNLEDNINPQELKFKDNNKAIKIIRKISIKRKIAKFFNLKNNTSTVNKTNETQKLFSNFVTLWKIKKRPELYFLINYIINKKLISLNKSNSSNLNKTNDRILPLFKGINLAKSLFYSRIKHNNNLKFIFKSNLYTVIKENLASLNTINNKNKYKTSILKFKNNKISNKSAMISRHVKGFRVNKNIKNLNTKFNKYSRIARIRNNSSIYFKYNRYLPSKSLPVKFINLINNNINTQGGTGVQNKLVLFNSLKFLNNIKNKNINTNINQMLNTLNNLNNQIELLIEIKLNIIKDKKIKKIKEIIKKRLIQLKIQSLLKRVEFFSRNKENQILYPANNSYIFNFKDIFEKMLDNHFDDQIIMCSDLNQILDNNNKYILLKNNNKGIKWSALNNSIKVKADNAYKLGRNIYAREESSLNSNSIKENNINMVKWIKWRVTRIKKFDYLVSSIINQSPVDVVYFSNNHVQDTNNNYFKNFYNWKNKNLINLKKELPIDPYKFFNYNIDNFNNINDTKLNEINYDILRKIRKYQIKNKFLPLKALKNNNLVLDPANTPANSLRENVEIDLNNIKVNSLSDDTSINLNKFNNITNSYAKLINLMNNNPLNNLSKVVKNTPLFKSPSEAELYNCSSEHVGQGLELSPNHFVNESHVKFNSPSPIINYYLKSMTSYNLIRQGTLMHFNRIIGYNFKTEKIKLFMNIYKLLSVVFKKMYCLISKPVFVIKHDKIIIHFFYYLFIPRILKNKKIKKKKIAPIKKWSNKKKNFNVNSMNYVLNLIKLKRHNNINKQSINLNQIKESTPNNNIVKLINSSPAQNKAQLIYKLKRLKNKINPTPSSLPTLTKKILRIRTVHSEISKLKLFNNRLFKNKISKLNLFKKNNSVKDLQLKKKKIKLFRKFVSKFNASPIFRRFYFNKYKFRAFTRIYGRKNKITQLYSNNSEIKSVHKYNIKRPENNLVVTAYNRKHIFTQPNINKFKRFIRSNGQNPKFKSLQNIKLNQFKKKKIKLFRKFKISHKKRLIKLSKVSLINFYPNRLKKVCEILNKIFKKNIELKLIRLHYPYKNSNILANFLAMLINKIKFRRITRKLFKFAIIKSISKAPNNSNSSANAASNKIIPSFLSGLKIKIGGRLMRYKIIPRKTTQLINRGASSFGRVNYTDYARYTNKNRKGAYSITVSSGQNFFN
jgi:hypothetical protein